MGPPEGAGDGASVGGSVQVHPAQLWPWPVKKAHVYSPGNSACHASQFLSSSIVGHASVGDQATKALRELFISLPAGVTEMQVTQFLNTQCYEQNICQMDITPVLSVRVNQDKAFGFVEFATPEICDVRRTSLLCRPFARVYKRTRLRRACSAS